MVLITQAPAKINLTLEVLGLRSDGYHELASVFHTLSYADEVTLKIMPPITAERPPSIRIAIVGMPAPLDSRNTVWQAIEQFWAHLPPVHPSTNTDKGQIHVNLLKRLPSMAGLGGGSSNAAAVLKLLALWAPSAGIPLPNLNEVALSVGSDVPFFLNAPCALVEGRGERVTPLPPLPPFAWIIAKPVFTLISTAWAYRQLKRKPLGRRSSTGERTEQLAQALLQGAIKTPTDLVPYLHNDFEPAILPACPNVQALRQRMLDLGVLAVLLCGSGGAQAGLCESWAQAEAIAHQLRIENEDYWSKVAVLLN